MNTSSVELPGRRTRRRHPADFKRRIVQACQQAGVSIAAVALANSLNANMVRKWVIEAEVTDQPIGASDARVASAAVPGRASIGATPMPGFIPISAPLAASESAISVEIHRGPTLVKVSWPTSAAADCAAWLRELVR